MENKYSPLTAKLDAGEKKVIPVLREEVEVRKRTVETGIARIRKTVREHEELVDEPILKDEVDIERVLINRYVEKPVASRQEDGVLIVPLMEEVIVVEKRLLLKEELHIRKRTKTIHDPQKVLLRSEEASIERTELGEDNQPKR